MIMYLYIADTTQDPLTLIIETLHKIDTKIQHNVYTHDAVRVLTMLKAGRSGHHAINL